MQPNKNEPIGFELSLSARDDGTLEAAYIRFRRAKVKETREVIEDTLLADYDDNGELLGLEILARVKLSKLANLVEASRRPSFRKFIKSAAPPDLVTA